MSIKSSQKLVEEANKSIETLCQRGEKTVWEKRDHINWCKRHSELWKREL